MNNTCAYKSEKGFSVLDIILGVALVAVTGVAGFYAYQNSSQAKSVAVSDYPKAKASPKASATPKPAASPAVTLGAAHFSFTAPAGWKVDTKPPVGYNFSDSSGDYINIDEDGAIGTAGATSVWLVNNNTANGITVDQKSPQCTTPGQTNFHGFSYICASGKDSTNIIAFMSAGGGEILVGGYHKYAIHFGNSNKAVSDTAVFENILKSFKVKN
jgi:hypothetical protein